MYLFEFFELLVNAVNEAFVRWPWLYYGLVGVFFLNVVAVVLRVLLYVRLIDPQDYDREIPPGPASRPQYDPEHWYTGKD